MPLIQVIPGTNRRVNFAELLGELRLAFQAYSEGALSKLREGEHLPRNLENGRRGAKRKRLYRSGEREAVITKRGGTHRINRDALAARLLC